MKFHSTLMAAFAVFGFAAGISTVHADQSFVPTKVVSFADLDLDSDVGAKTFYGRIQTAAKTVCIAYDGRDLSSAMRMQSCIDNAVGTAVSQTNNGKVTALYSHSKAASRTLVASR